LLTFCALSLSTLSNFYFTPICANLESDVTADVMCNKLYILCKGCAANQSTVYWSIVIREPPWLRHSGFLYLLPPPQWVCGGGM
jgi:hypothetical protein